MNLLLAYALVWLSNQQKLTSWTWNPRYSSGPNGNQWRIDYWYWQRVNYEWMRQSSLLQNGWNVTEFTWPSIYNDFPQPLLNLNISTNAEYVFSFETKNLAPFGNNIVNDF